MEPGPPLYSRDRYRIYASPGAGDFDDCRIAAYLVLTTSGVTLRREPSFEQARDWVDARIAMDIAAPGPDRRPGQRRRR